MISSIEAARLIFGCGMIFHQIITGALTGMALAMVFLALFSYVYHLPLNQKIFALWVRLFSLQFAIAVMSGITLHTGSNENWPGAQVALVPLINHPMGRSAAIGFFLVSICLITLFIARDEVSSFIVILISLTILIATWMMSAWGIVINSWMQTPSGVDLIIKNGQVISAHITDLKSLIFNQSMLYRMVHTQVASFIQGFIFLFVVLVWIGKSIPSHYLSVRPMLFVTGWLILILLLSQPVIGHLQYVTMTRSQPSKAAAIESYYHAEEGFHIYVIGVTRSDVMDIKGIHLPEYIETLCMKTISAFPPLDTIAQELRPPTDLVFYSFRIMIFCWAAMTIGIGYILHTIFKNKPFWGWQSAFLFILFILSIIASLSGWMVSETGRQPWIIYDIVKTKQTASLYISNIQLALSLMCNVFLPVILGTLWIKLQQRELKSIDK